MMEFKRFEAILYLWKDLHFTGIELQQRDNKSEIYATGTNHHTLSQLYICNVSSESSPQAQLKQFRAWLHKINIGRTKRMLDIAQKD